VQALEELFHLVERKVLDLLERLEVEQEETMPVTLILLL
jgi:hypothetical protein